MIALNTNLLTFSAPSWGEADYFSHFYAATYAFDSETRKRLSGAKGHFNKAVIITRLLGKLAPGMQHDVDELNERGFTEAANSNEFSAVAESVFAELYSSIDCARKVVTTVFRGCRRMPDSTRKLFQAIAQGVIGEDMPEPVRAAFRNATWYPRLRMIRDELTHADVGTCRLSSDGTGKIVYTHFSMRVGGQPLQVSDLMGEIAQLTDDVNRFMGELFRALNELLRPTHADVLCGFFNGGRAYMRRIANERPITFDSGSCLSREWFDSDSTARCPFAANCGAYARSPAGPAAKV